MQIGDTEFTHFKQPREALSAGSHNAHFMFVTPNDDHSFTLFTVNHYTGSDPEFFQKLSPSRKVEAKTEKKPYDRRKYSPFRGNVRTEDIACQGNPAAARSAQGAAGDIGQRRDLDPQNHSQCDSSGAGKARSQGSAADADQAHEMVTIDSFTGVRAKGINVTWD